MKISVCIPTFNSSKTIKMCLDSIFNQTLLPDEVLICDGNSKDDTLKIIESYPIYVIATNISGIGAARNILLKSSKGELIFWIDSDVVIPKNYLETVSRIFDSNPEFDCLCGPSPVVDIQAAKKVINKELIIKDQVFKKERIMSFSAVTTKKSVVEEVGGFDPIFDRGEDWDLTIRLLKINANIYWCYDLVSYHIFENKFKKSLKSGNYILYLLKYGKDYIIDNPKHFISFILRLWLLYSLFLFPFFGLISLLNVCFSVFANLLAITIYKNFRLYYLLEQLLKAIGEHINLYRYIKFYAKHR